MVCRSIEKMIGVSVEREMGVEYDAKEFTLVLLNEQGFRRRGLKAQFAPDGDGRY